VSLVLRGVSGAGKTELSKYLLQSWLALNSTTVVAVAAEVSGAAGMAKKNSAPSSAASPCFEHDHYEPLGTAFNPLLLLDPLCPVARGMAAATAVMHFFTSAEGAAGDRQPHSSRTVRETRCRAVPCRAVLCSVVDSTVYRCCRFYCIPLLWILD
jgi:hypothetical protein